MNLKSLTIGMTVRHPQYGIGTVKSLNEHVAEIRFDEGMKSVDPSMGQLSPAEAQAEITGLDMPLADLIESVAKATMENFEWEQPEVEELGSRWHGGKLALHPADVTFKNKHLYKKDKPHRRREESVDDPPLGRNRKAQCHESCE